MRNLTLYRSSKLSFLAAALCYVLSAVQVAHSQPFTIPGVGGGNSTNFPNIDINSIINSSPSGSPGLPSGGGGTNSAGVSAYESDNSFTKELMNSQVKRTASQAGAYGTDNPITDKLTLPPLPGEQSMTDSTGDATTFAPNGQVPKTSREKYEGFQVRLPTLIGMRQMMDADPMKNMIRDLTTKKVPVLFQTHMMVENGAGTGFIGAMSTINGIMSNTLQSHDLQLQLLDLTDHTGVQKEAYVRGMQKALEESGQDAWPVALYGAVGDQAEGNIRPFSQLQQRPAFGVDNLPGAVGGNKMVKLSEMLFLAADAPSDAQANINRLKQDFIRYLGDYNIEETPVAGTTIGVTTKLTREKPETKEQRRGLARAKWEEQAVAFESLAQVLKVYCEFKRSEDNVNLKAFEKKSAALALQRAMDQSVSVPMARAGKPSAWEYASAPDIPLSVNLIEQLYMLMMKTTLHEKNLPCDSLNLTAADIPSAMAPAAGTVNLDDCSNNQGCIRNRLLVFISDVVGRSRALHLYRALIEQSYKFAMTPELQKYLTMMLREEFGDFDINQEIVNNRQRWEEFQQFFARVMQGQNGGSAFRANMDSNVAAGFVAGR